MHKAAPTLRTVVSVPVLQPESHSPSRDPSCSAQSQQTQSKPLVAQRRNLAIIRLGTASPRCILPSLHLVLVGRDPQHAVVFGRTCRHFPPAFSFCAPCGYGNAAGVSCIALASAWPGPGPAANPHLPNRGTRTLYLFSGWRSPLLIGIGQKRRSRPGFRIITLCRLPPPSAARWFISNYPRIAASS
ncbi:hypothetical protein VUR80DRAFT_1424 [Thermomyces stellatus]